MPQKKNPDVLELTRGKTGQVIGSLLDLMINLKGLPMTYNRDLQEDKRGLWQSLDTAESVINIMSDLLSRVEVDEKISLARLENGYSLATDVAEYLVNKGVPFREAHLKAGRLVGWCIDNNLLLTDLTLSQWQENIPEVDADIMKFLTPREAVRRRNIYGATGFEQVDLQINEARKRI